MSETKRVFRNFTEIKILLFTATVIFGVFRLEDAYAADCKNWLDSSAPVPTNYGAAYNLLSEEQELLLSGSECETTSFRLQIGSGFATQYIYKSAYFNENNIWQKVNMEGDALREVNWFQGSASKVMTTTDLRAGKFVLGFICQYKSGDWKCGCRDEACVTPFWQMQYVRPVAQAPDAGNQTENDLSNKMALAGSHTFSSPSGEAVVWKVDRLTTDEVLGATSKREANVFTVNGVTATFDLINVPGKETSYEITASGNNAAHTFTIQVFPAIQMSSLTHKSIDSPDVLAYIFVPQSLSPTTRLITLIHDSSRSAENALSNWMNWLSKNNYIGIAPEFPYPEWSNSDFNEGKMFIGEDGYGSKYPESKWSFTIADDIAKKVISDFGLINKRYDMFGHSGGGRFTHRFMMFKPDAPIRFAFPANPGVWTLPSMTHRFPWGLRHPHFSYKEQDLLNWTNRKMIIVRGMNDVVRDFGLDVTPEGDAQGLNRVVRAQLAYDLAKAVNPDLAWELLDVPNCGHSDGCTAAAAQNYLETDFAD